MLQLAGEKMSKSIGNLITIDEFLGKHSADALRVLIFTGDYRREATESARASFNQAMDDDFNTSGALAVLFELVKAINTARSAGVGGPFFMAAQKTLRELGGVLGLQLEATNTEMGGSSVEVAPFIDLLIDVRTGLRTAKQWELADTVRDRLTELGVTLEDSADGTNWRLE